MFCLVIFQVKKGICVWLAWMLRMKRPGQEEELGSIFSKDSTNPSTIHELHEYTNLASRSLMSNIRDDDDYSLPSSPQLNGNDYCMNNSINRIREVRTCIKIRDSAETNF